MNIIHKIVVLAVLTVMSANTAISADKLPTVELLGKQYYVYEVKKGDSLFGISKANGWDYEQLCRLNPKAVSPLEKGQLLYYPVKSEMTSTTGKEAQSVSAVIHRVNKGETVYGISRLYGVPVDAIFKLNPGSDMGIRDGQTLLIKEGIVNSNDINPDYYTIKKGDTLYGVAKSYGTTVAELMKKNPGVSEKNFKAGEVIRLPRRGEGVKQVVESVSEEQLQSVSSYKVDKKDTWDTIAEKTGVDKDDLIEANKEMGDKPKNKSYVTIPNIQTTSVEKIVEQEDPRELTSDGISEIYEDVHGLSDADQSRSLNIVLLLSEPASRKDLEFTRGFLTGIDRFKKTGAEINLTVMDGNRLSTDVLNELSEKKPDIIFLTTEKGIPAYLAEYAEVSQTPMVNTFDVKNELFTTNPYIIQLLTPSNNFNEEIAGKIKEDYGNYKLIFVGNVDENDLMATAIQESRGKGEISRASVEGILKYPFKDDVKYLIYGYASKKEDVSELLNAIIEVKSKSPLLDITVLGRPSWIVYDESSFEDKYHKANVLIPSRFYFDKESRQSRQFVNHYKSLFDKTPTKSFPMYACVGYDASSYFVEGLLNNGRDINMLVPSKAGTQNEFELKRPGNWTGIMNPVVYLVRYTPYDTIDKIVVR